MKKLFRQFKNHKYYKQGMLIFAAIIIMSFFVGISMIMIKVTSSIKKSSADSAQQGTQYNTAANMVFLVRDQLQLIATNSYTKVLGFNWVNNTDLTKIVGKSTDIVQTIKILPKLGMETEYEDQFKPNSKNHKNIRKAATTNRGQSMMKKNSKNKDKDSSNNSQPTEATTYSVDAVINSPSSLTKFANRANTIGGYWVETKDIRIDPTDNTQAEYIFQIYGYVCDKSIETGSMICQENGNIATYDQEFRIKRRCPYIVDNQLVVANEPGTDFYHLNCTCPCSTNCPDNSSDTGTGQATNVSGCNCLDTTYYWDATGGSCLPCPTGTTTDGQYDASNITSCMCNDVNKPYWNFGNKLCEACPVNSSINNSGTKIYTIVEDIINQSASGSIYNTINKTQTTYDSKCACLPNYNSDAYSGCTKIVACPTNSSITGVGQSTNVSGCNCLDTTYYWDAAGGSCLPCPANSATNGIYDQTDISACKCSTNISPYWYAGFQYGKGSCGACPKFSDLNNTGTNIDNITLDGIKFKFNPNASSCRCASNYYYDKGSSGNCLACPVNCSTCISATMCSVCNDGYTLSNGTCAAAIATTPCPAGSSKTGTGQDTNVAECKCNTTSFYWDSSKGSCEECPNNATTDGTGMQTYLNFCICHSTFGETRYIDAKANTQTACEQECKAQWPDRTIKNATIFAKQQEKCYCKENNPFWCIYSNDTFLGIPTTACLSSSTPNSSTYLCRKCPGTPSGLEYIGLCPSEDLPSKYPGYYRYAIQIGTVSGAAVCCACPSDKPVGGGFGSGIIFDSCKQPAENLQLNGGG
jgi:hypothetical protein